MLGAWLRKMLKKRLFSIESGTQRRASCFWSWVSIVRSDPEPPASIGRESADSEGAQVAM
jgi:hypothetical protein